MPQLLDRLSPLTHVAQQAVEGESDEESCKGCQCQERKRGLAGLSLDCFRMEPEVRVLGIGDSCCTGPNLVGERRYPVRIYCPVGSRRGGQSHVLQQLYLARDNLFQIQYTLQSIHSIRGQFLEAEEMCLNRRSHRRYR